jgi:hypothetical protein
MKTSLGALTLVFLVSCGAHEEAHESANVASDNSHKAKASKAADSKYVDDPSDNRIGLPPYPGSKEFANSRVTLRTDIGETFGVSYETTASPTEVEAFYKTEAAKLGTLEESLALSDMLKSVAAKQPDGSTLAVQATSIGDGRTTISLHKFIPTKK